MNISSTVALKNLSKQQPAPKSCQPETSQEPSSPAETPTDLVELSSVPDLSTKEKALVGAGLVALGAGSLAVLSLAPVETLTKMAVMGAGAGVVTAGLGFVSTGSKEASTGAGMLGFVVGSGMVAGAELLANAAASGASPGGGGALIAGLLCGGAFTSLGGLGVAAPLLGGSLILEAGQETFGSR